MKNIIIIFTLFFALTNCKAQEGRVEPLSRYGDFPSGTYYKDTTESMTHYIGTWKGVHDGKHILLKIQKLTKKRNDRDNGKYWYEDEIIGRYIVYSGDPNLSSTTIIANSMDQIKELAPFKGVGDGRNNEFEFAYTDYQFCSASGDLNLVRNLSNPNELTYKFNVRGTFLFEPDCPYNGTIPVPLPRGIMTLTKVN